MLFADLLSLHLVTFLMFLILVYIYIKPEATLHFEVQRFQQSGMEICIQTPTGNTIILDVTSSDTVRTIKSQIETQTGMPQAQQQLVFNCKYSGTSEIRTPRDL